MPGPTHPGLSRAFFQNVIDGINLCESAGITSSAAGGNLSVSITSLTTQRDRY